MINGESEVVRSSLGGSSFNEGLRIKIFMECDSMSKFSQRDKTQKLLKSQGTDDQISRNHKANKTGVLLTTLLSFRACGVQSVVRRSK